MHIRGVDYNSLEQATLQVLKTQVQTLVARNMGLAMADVFVFLSAGSVLVTIQIADSVEMSKEEIEASFEAGNVNEEVINIAKAIPAIVAAAHGNITGSGLKPKQTSDVSSTTAITEVSNSSMAQDLQDSDLGAEPQDEASVTPVLLAVALSLLILGLASGFGYCWWKRCQTKTKQSSTNDDTQPDATQVIDVQIDDQRPAVVDEADISIRAAAADKADKPSTVQAIRDGFRRQSSVEKFIDTIDFRNFTQKDKHEIIDIIKEEVNDSPEPTVLRAAVTKLKTIRLGHNGILQIIEVLRDWLNHSYSAVVVASIECLGDMLCDTNLSSDVKEKVFQALLDKFNSQKSTRFADEAVTTGILRVFNKALDTDNFEWEARKEQFKQMFIKGAEKVMGEVVAETATPVLKEVFGEITGEGQGLLRGLLHKLNILPKDEGEKK
eukprot:TRINITY_DN6892_c0_g2_i13.p1 TRINITY_DN6892_c0_g2~~TRINITY_DN6892_c0_g2_i13.p1  ORF type:complete len:438 (+),score=112.68 TRINITY_DN6892_c0_g2_i13:1056-2369(+)